MAIRKIGDSCKGRRQSRALNILLINSIIMQKVIDYYFLIVSGITTIVLFCCCVYDNSRTMISITALSFLLSLLYILNVFKSSLFSRMFVKCITLIVSLIIAIVFPLFIIIATYRYEILLYLVIAFCILSIILALFMKTETR